ncbi:hypothetical protein [Proteiniclasticum sp. QWL-01]|uniref:hypothetical protein n=1 Tax=Proteiniclasticum sp. QWL-01 TaxID=3036945 RepID=UPI0021F95068|nr:hypothetical protein [Proteiniclasticum sp. QWL-01]UUM12355.1 hypothetical protein NQU17_02005 [Clostridiaceae bacterium HFYG-1003]WFF73885.1 hypothetical protein P6M73_05405 [Proteiniclasticum sp. QWL-01]
MIQVFMSKRGSGKSKYMISHANTAMKETKGHVVFIDDDNRAMHELDRDIRFINTDGYEIEDLNSLYGFVCGIVAQDYDVDMVYVDGLMGKMDFSKEDAEKEFEKLSKLSDDNKITVLFALNDTEQTPEYLKKYKVEIE